jgi:subtilisin family serine protease
MKQVVLGLGSLALIGSFGFVNLRCQGADPGKDNPVVVPSAKAQYYVFHIEFANAQACEAACQNFPSNDAYRTYPFWHGDRFADAFVDPRRLLSMNNPTSEDILRSHQQIQKDLKEKLPNVTWVDYATISTTPPTVRPVELSGLTARAVVGASPLAAGDGLAVATGPATRDVVEDTIVRGGLNGFPTGKGVIIAIVDSGVDFRHPDFIREENGNRTSRLLYFWDTLSDTYVAGQGRRGSQVRPPVKWPPPDGNPIGVIYTGKELTDEINGLDPQIHMWDTGGHGSACAGVAAGNGRASQGRYVGVAPEADLIAVRIAENEKVDNDYLINAICDWIDNVAQKEHKPVVVSCSWGGQSGPHDGNLVYERALSERFSLDRQGRALCVAAGNDAVSGKHSEVALDKGNPQAKLEWTAGADGHLSLFFAIEPSVIWKTPGTLVIGSEPARFNGIEIDSLTGSSLAKLSVQFNAADGTPVKDGVKLRCYYHPLSRTPVLNALIPPGAGSAELQLTPQAAVNVRADAYIFGTGSAFKIPSVAKLVGSPATAVNAIAVGSYDWNDQFDFQGQLRRFSGVDHKPLTINALSFYSSPGPSRNPSTMKPHIVAPGEWYTAPRTRNAPVMIDPDSTGMYQLLDGTSAATPYTAGVIALLFQKRPTLTNGQVKDLLRTNATHDDYTQKIPDAWDVGKVSVGAGHAAKDDGQHAANAWGYGRLSVAAVRAMLSALDSQKQ